ncbi:MAG: 3-oxoacyl-ACP reductase FabG [Hahellaceae bacterium]|nr:3-oxoacyl-ACP reductase FabG [Hahellaceae bacterium]
MSQKVALVTGASRGIGRAIAETLVVEGYWVVGTATTVGGADKISDYLTAGKGVGIACDVTQPEQVAALLSRIESEYGTIAVLVNNAGITRDGLILRMKDEDWHAVLETNLTSVFRLCKAVSRGMMKARWGRIINISSVVASMGNAGQVNYAAAKGGLEALTRTLARELGSRGITLNAVAPGFIDTDMTHALSDSQREAMLQAVPLGRLGQPSDVAAVVAFLASDGAGYITGETIQVNGGMYMA